MNYIEVAIVLVGGMMSVELTRNDLVLVWPAVFSYVDEKPLKYLHVKLIVCYHRWYVTLVSIAVSASTLLCILPT